MNDNIEREIIKHLSRTDGEAFDRYSECGDREDWSGQLQVLKAGATSLIEHLRKRADEAELEGDVFQADMLRINAQDVQDEVYGDWDSPEARAEFEEDPAMHVVVQLLLFNGLERTPEGMDALYALYRERSKELASQEMWASAAEAEALAWLVHESDWLVE